MDDCVLRVGKVQNGFTAEIVDEKTRANNQKPKTSWEDPWKSYVFPDAKSLLDFLTTHVEGLKPPPDADDEFSQGFASATASDD